MSWKIMEFFTREETSSNFLIWAQGWRRPLIAAFDHIYDEFYDPNEYVSLPTPTHWMECPDPPDLVE